MRRQRCCWPPRPTPTRPVALQMPVALLPPVAPRQQPHPRLVQEQAVPWVVGLRSRTQINRRHVERARMGSEDLHDRRQRAVLK